MRHAALLALLILVPLHLPALAEEEAPAIFRASWNFDEKPAEGAWAATATGEAARRMPTPKRVGDKLYLLQSWMDSSAAIAFPAPTEERVRVVQASWVLLMNTGSEGAGFLWLPTETHGARGDAPEMEAWEAPSLAGAFGIGFDASNPVNRDPFRGSGNAYDRPQHEVSLHWDGMEIVKKRTPMDFRDEEEHRVEMRIVFVTGGAEVSLAMDDVALFDAYFIPSMLPYAGRPAFGARNSKIAGDVLLDDLACTCREVVGEAPAPLAVTALERVLNDKKHPRNEAVVAFPEDTDAYGRIVLTLRLDKPETRFDPWDRSAHIYLYDEDGEKHEILRYITPYHRGHVWQVDVSAFRPLLKGEKKIEQACGTQGEGWVVTVRFDFYPGPADLYAYDLARLWSGKCIVGNPEKPAAEFYDTKTVEVPKGCESAEVRTVVTGHGMSPNSNNAAEFMPIDRTLTVNGTATVNKLWKDDNYLNPCRPQGGTWKYDRAGWAPGDVVRPWVVDVSEQAASGTLTVGYALAPYVNENRGKTWEPFHSVEGYVVFYKTLPRAIEEAAPARRPLEPEPEELEAPAEPREPEEE